MVIAVSMASCVVGIVGVVLEVSRSDWLRELDKPEKSWEFLKHCSYWWLVTAENVVNDITEIPGNWGWKCVSQNGQKLITKKVAPELEATLPGWKFLAALFRASTEKLNLEGLVPEKDIDELVAAKMAEKEKAMAAIVEGHKKNKEQALAELESLRAGVNEFNRIAGTNIPCLGRNYGQFARQANLFREFQDGGADKFKNSMKKTLNDLEHLTLYMKGLINE